MKKRNRRGNATSVTKVSGSEFYSPNYFLRTLRRTVGEQNDSFPSKCAHSDENFDQQKFIFNSHQWVRTCDRLFIYNWVEFDDAVFDDTLFQLEILRDNHSEWLIANSCIVCSE